MIKLQFMSRFVPSRLISAGIASVVLLGAHVPLVGQVAVLEQLPLWEVSRGGTSIYLLGSVHMLRQESYPLDPALYDAFDSARVVAFELDLGTAAAAAPLMMSRGMYTDGRTLQTELPAELLAELQSRVAELGVPFQVLAMMKPWMVGLTLNSLMLQRLGYAPELGVDMHFYQRAQRSGKRVVAFETVEQQIEVFDGLPADQQVALLESTLEEIDSASATMDEISQIWETGDVDRLAGLMTESMQDQPLLLERILHQRNRNWVPQIESLLTAGQPAIVIVGMGHLVGEGSVTDLLEDAGYTVRAVEATAR